MIFTPASCTILTAIFFIGFLAGHKYSAYLYKRAMQEWTENIYSRYRECIHDKDVEIKRLRSKLNI